MEGDVIHIHLLLHHLVLFCKRLLISWLQSPSAVILEPPKLKSVTISIVFPSIFHEVMGPDAMKQESLVEAWVGGGMLQGQGHRVKQWGAPDLLK